MFRTIFQELFLAGAVDSVIEGGAAAIVQLVNARRKKLHVVGKILHQLHMAVKPLDECLIEANPQRVLQKRGGRALLEIETAIDRSTYVDKQPQVQG